MVLAVGSIPLALLAGCAESGGGDVSTEAFIGPSSYLLDSKLPPECTGNQIEAGDTLTVSAADYLPDAVITMRWTVLSDNETGTWPSVTADANGRFATDLKISGSMADPGEEITITSQGTGESGLTMHETKVVMGTC